MISKTSESCDVAGQLPSCYSHVHYRAGAARWKCMHMYQSLTMICDVRHRVGILCHLATMCQ